MSFNQADSLVIVLACIFRQKGAKRLISSKGILKTTTREHKKVVTLLMRGSLPTKGQREEQHTRVAVKVEGKGIL
jgi:hypothetical protein